MLANSNVVGASLAGNAVSQRRTVHQAFIPSSPSCSSLSACLHELAAPFFHLHLQVNELAGVKLDRDINVVAFNDGRQIPLPPGTGYVDENGQVNVNMWRLRA